jgi:1-acyl-sn-glycerol-3-phosphate acyltransferase
VNRQKIPAKSPVIFAINHQNALMDALAILFATRGQKVFMARADIFRKKTIAGILYFLKILPAYRIRDGFHSVDQNNGVFKEVISVLEHKKPFCILPEGNHYGEKRLRPLQKGAGRLALLAEEVNDFKLGLFIVPVGLDYSNYFNAGSELLVNFGDPIRIADYQVQYAQNPVQAISQLRNDLAAAMKKVMIDIEPAERYKTIHAAIELYGPVALKKQKLSNSLLNKFTVKKQLTETLISHIPGNEEAFRNLKAEIEGYENKIKKYGIKDRTIAHNTLNPMSFLLNSIVTLLLLPLHVYGMILNYLPYGLPVYLARKIKDRHFLSSIRFTAGLLMFIVWYLALIIVSLFLFHNLVLNLAFIISIPLAGIFAFYYYIHLMQITGKFRWLKLKMRDRKSFNGIIKQREEILLKIESMKHLSCPERTNKNSLA